MQLQFQLQERPRRNRSRGWLREMIAETGLSVRDLIYPIFITDQDQTVPVKTLPGQMIYTLKDLPEKVQLISDAGIQAIALFPNISQDKKYEDAREAYSQSNLVCEAIQLIKSKFPHIGVICDVALDGYTLSGHDGIIDDAGAIKNDVTVEILSKMAVNFAQAGCDVVAPSDMMDGRVQAIRTSLDEAQFQDTIILSYAVKYASSFYGPFRDATGTMSCLKGDKKTYQMDPRNRVEAFREVRLDIEEGADILMVKPGLPYLDILKQIKENCDIPVFCYQVSGEYAMIKAAAELGYLNAEDTLYESLLCIKRAGADAIFTYGALEIADQLKK